MSGTGNPAIQPLPSGDVDIALPDETARPAPDATGPAPDATGPASAPGPDGDPPPGSAADAVDPA